MRTIEERVEEALQERFNEIMAENPAMTVCLLCDGMGCVTIDVPVEHAAFGKAFKCPCNYLWVKPATAAKQQAALDKLFGNDGIPKRIAHHTFEDFKSLPELEYQAKQKAINAARKLAENGQITLKSGIIKYGLVIAGANGLGKTSLAVATAREIAKRGNAVLFKDYNDLVSDIQETYNKDWSGPTKTKLLDAVSQTPVLILDDLGAVKETDHLSADERKILYALMRPRWASSKVTIITTNLSKVRFKEEVDPRMFRRLRDLCAWIDMGGSDLTAYGLEAA